MNIETYQVPEGQKRAGMYSFRVDGQESLFYSTSEASIAKKVTQLLNGPSAGTVKLKPVAAGAKPMHTHGGEHQASVDHFSLPTAAERVKSFMSRGKLAGK